MKKIKAPHRSLRPQFWGKPETRPANRIRVWEEHNVRLRGLLKDCPIFRCSPELGRGGNLGLPRIGGRIGIFSLCLLLLAILNPIQAAPATPNIHIKFDDTAVTQLLALRDAKDTSDASLVAWLKLPANQYLLRIGSNEDNLTYDRLKANAIAVILDKATPQNQPFMDIGSLRMSPPEDYKLMLDGLRATAEARISRILARDSEFCPPGVDITETVYLHMGGDWDAVNDNGSIYINMRFWHDNVRPSWDGLDMIIAHETIHTIQNQTYGNPQNQTDSDGAFLTALSKLQREGTARYVETETDPGPYTEGTYGYNYRAIDAERLRAFPRDILILQHLYDACYPTFDHDKFVDAFANGIGNGGSYYDIGHGMAKAIDERLGRAALIETIKNGPKDFFRKYIYLSALDPKLPKLPLDVAKQTGAMPENLQ